MADLGKIWTDISKPEASAPMLLLRQVRSGQSVSRCGRGVSATPYPAYLLRRVWVKRAPLSPTFSSSNVRPTHCPVLRYCAVLLAQYQPGVRYYIPAYALFGTEFCTRWSACRTTGSRSRSGPTRYQRAYLLRACYSLSATGAVCGTTA
eukprot:3712559-Rhodomonas_salina.1